MSVKDENPKVDTSEQISSFPWILQTVAARLGEIARRLETEERKGLRIPVTDKLVKEALLAALAANGPNGEDPVDSLMRLIRSQDG